MKSASSSLPLVSIPRQVRAYRSRRTARKLLSELDDLSSLQEMRDWLTEIVLNRVGLTIAGDDEAGVAPGLLDDAQRQAIALVGEQGYRAKIR